MEAECNTAADCDYSLPAPRQLILFVLLMNFCTQMEQNRDPVELAELLFCYCTIFLFSVLFSFVTGRRLVCWGDSIHTCLMAHTQTHKYVHTHGSVASSYVESNTVSPV